MKRVLAVLGLILVLLGLSQCATSDKEFDRQKVSRIEEFEKVVKIEKIEEPAPEKTEVKKSPSKPTKKKASDKASSPKTKTAKKSESGKKLSEKPVKQTKAAIKKIKAKKRQPKLEDTEGFVGRRPLVDPFRSGEEVVLGVTYFGVEAGRFTMQVLPMVQVNGRRSYHFRYLIKSSPLFSMFYSVNDVAETFVDYETLLPNHYEIHVDESKQVRETKTFFDHKKSKAMMWDQKQKKGKEVEKKKLAWDLLPYSQNVFSAGFYLRNFTLKVGKKLKVRVGHEGKNIIMTAEVIRRERLATDVGDLDTFVVRPKFDIDGKFKPTGDNLIWITADERKFVVRLESKIKIGTLVGSLKSLKK